MASLRPMSRHLLDGPMPGTEGASVQTLAGWAMTTVAIAGRATGRVHSRWAASLGDQIEWLLETGHQDAWLGPDRRLTTDTGDY